MSEQSASRFSARGMILVLLFAVHFAYAIVAPTTDTNSLYVDSAIYGARTASLAVLAAVAALGPGTAVRRLPIVLFLGCLWFCATALGGRLDWGDVHRRQQFSEAQMAVYVIGLGVLAGITNRRRPVSLTFNLPINTQSTLRNRLALGELMLWPTGLSVSCVLIGYSVTPNAYLGVVAADPPSAWLEWILPIFWQGIEFQLAIIAALAASLAWALPCLGPYRCGRTLLLIAGSASVAAAAFIAIAGYWPYLSSFPKTAKVMRIHYEAAWGTYTGAALAVLFTAAHLRVAGMTFKTPATRNLPAPRISTASKKWSIAVLVAVLVLLYCYAMATSRSWGG